MGEYEKQALILRAQRLLARREDRSIFEAQELDKIIEKLGYTPMTDMGS